MELKIVEKLITTDPKVNFYVMLGTDKLRVKKIDRDEVTLSDDSVITANEIRDKIVKYTAISTNPKLKKEFNVLFSDYERVSDGLVLEGYPVEAVRTAREGDLVRVTDIEVIDMYGLYDVKLRQGEIISVLQHSRHNVEYEIQFEEERRLLKLKRNQFSLSKTLNSKQYFHPRCPECGN